MNVKPLETQSNEPVLQACKEIIMRLGKDGGFLLALAEAMVVADPENFATMKPAVQLILSKYGLLK